MGDSRIAIIHPVLGVSRSIVGTFENGRSKNDLISVGCGFARNPEYIRRTRAVSAAQGSRSQGAENQESILVGSFKEEVVNVPHSRTTEKSRPGPHPRIESSSAGSLRNSQQKRGQANPTPSSNPTVETLSCRIDVTTAE
jgi:hypothetical protein